MTEEAVAVKSDEGSTTTTLDEIHHDAGSLLIGKNFTSTSSKDFSTIILYESTCPSLLSYKIVPKDF
jgi:hypothetical protein